VAGLIVEIVAEDDDVDRHAKHRGDEVGRSQGRRDDLQPLILIHRFGQQLGMYARTVGNDDADEF
jgi:hypothetical protein